MSYYSSNRRGFLIVTTHGAFANVDIDSEVAIATHLPRWLPIRTLHFALGGALAGHLGA